ncbi:hypothetical protein TNCV_1348001 [Trichonephila clavipes]|nr:hypothetical protein TNCV_1348001 [Trichonephila clavipes]
MGDCTGFVEVVLSSFSNDELSEGHHMRYASWHVVRADWCIANGRHRHSDTNLEKPCKENRLCVKRVGSEVGPTKGFCEGDNRNRWRDGQVCPDDDKELWRLGPDFSGVFWCWTKTGETRKERSEEEDKRVRGKERTEKRERRRKETERESGRENGRNEEERRKRERGDGKRVGEKESEAHLEWRKGLSPEIGVKKTMNAGGVENGNMN